MLPTAALVASMGGNTGQIVNTLGDQLPTGIALTLNKLSLLVSLSLLCLVPSLSQTPSQQDLCLKLPQNRTGLMLQV
jgi:hypothetical protein